MAKFNFLGISVTIGFDNDLVEKTDKYWDLYEQTYGAEDRGEIQDWDEYHKKSDERFSLFHELRDAGVDLGGEPEPEEKSGSFLGWLFG